MGINGISLAIAKCAHMYRRLLLSKVCQRFASGVDPLQPCDCCITLHCLRSPHVVLRYQYSTAEVFFCLGLLATLPAE
jgi:hypothetical protein